MTRFKLLMGSISALALTAGSTVASAEEFGTSAGTTIENLLVVTYRVNGVDQEVLMATNNFVVDRKLDVTVAWQDAAPVEVAPGKADAVTTFLVTNLTNDTTDFLLTAQQVASDDYDPLNVRIFVETDGTEGFSEADELASALFGLDPGESATVYVVADQTISATLPIVLPSDGDTASVILSARFATGVTQIEGFAGSGGTAIVSDDRADPDDANTVQNTFADAAGDATGDGVRDGVHSDTGSWIIAGATLDVSKVSRIVGDPINGTTNPKAIPGAVVEYCIVVANTAGSATASDVSVIDPVPVGLIQTGVINITGPVPVASNACTASVTGSGAMDSGDVVGQLPALAPGEQAALVFRAVLN